MAGLRRGAALFDYIAGSKPTNGEKPVNAIMPAPRDMKQRAPIDEAHAGNSGETATDYTPDMTKSSPGGVRDLGIKPTAAIRGAARSSSSESAPPPKERAGLIEIADDRLRIHLTTLGAAILLFVFTFSLFGLYEVGRIRGQRLGFEQGYDQGRAAAPDATGDEIASAQLQNPATELVQGLLQNGGAAKPRPGQRGADPGSGKTSSSAGQSAGPAVWVPGLTYIVVQEFGRDANEAIVAAQAFLRSRGVATVPVRGDNGVVRLISAQGFHRQEPAQRRLSDEFIEKIRSMGAEYYRSGGGYKLEGYFATLKGDTW